MKKIFLSAIPIVIGGIALLTYITIIHNKATDTTMKVIEFPYYAGDIKENLTIVDEINDNDIANSDALNNYFTIAEDTNDRNIEKIVTYFSLNDNQILKPENTLLQEEYE